MGIKVSEVYTEIALKGGAGVLGQLKGLINSTMALKVGLLAATASLYEMSRAARETAQNLDIYQKNTGLSGEQLQQLSLHAAQAGVSMNELGGTIQRIQQMSMDVLMGKGMPEPFMWLQIDPRQNPVNQLEQIGSKLRALQQTQPALAKNIANQLGLSEKMYYSLLDNTEQWEELSKRFLLTEKEQKSMVKLNKEWNKLWFYIKQLTIKFGALGSALQSRFVKILTNAVKGLAEIIGRVSDFIEANEKLKNILLIIAAIFATYFAPELAVLAAVALALEDIFVYFEGGDSVTGQIVEWCKQSEKFQHIWQGIVTVFELVKATLKGLQIVWENAISPIFKKIIELSDSKIGGFLLDVLGKTFNPLGSTLESLGQVSEIIRPQTTGTTNTNNSNVTVTNHVNYQGTGNPYQDGKDFAKGISEEISDAQYQNPALAQG